MFHQATYVPRAALFQTWFLFRNSAKRWNCSCCSADASTRCKPAFPSCQAVHHVSEHSFQREHTIPPIAHGSDENKGRFCQAIHPLTCSFSVQRHFKAGCEKTIGRCEGRKFKKRERNPTGRRAWPDPNDIRSELQWFFCDSWLKVDWDAHIFILTASSVRAKAIHFHLARQSFASWWSGGRRLKSGHSLINGLGAIRRSIQSHRLYDRLVTFENSYHPFDSLELSWRILWMASVIVQFGERLPSLSRKAITSSVIMRVQSVWWNVDRCNEEQTNSPLSQSWLQMEWEIGFLISVRTHNWNDIGEEFERTLFI
jgi:hypothetical protein